MIRIEKPLIAATLHLERELTVLSLLAEEKVIDAVEFRADMFHRRGGASLDEILSRIKSAGLPVILTFRQGEAAGVSETKRLRIIEELIPEADAVDVELGSEIAGKVVDKAKSLSKTVIISEHDFEKTPADEQLRLLFRNAVSKGADIVKVAVMPEVPGDAARLMCFCLEASGKHPVVCISMGDTGKFTRFYAPFFGSSITYGSIFSPAAPGQVGVRELDKEISRFFRR